MNPAPKDLSFEALLGNLLGHPVSADELEQARLRFRMLSEVLRTIASREDETP